MPSPKVSPKKSPSSPKKVASPKASPKKASPKSAKKASPKASKKSSKVTKAAKVDGDKPKRPLSPFIKFSNAKRGEVKAANPEFKIGDVGKALGAMWNQLSAEEKAKFA